ncbi:copper-transporting ATPase [Photobacterium aquae]|uniref:Copper-exporting P-type ATPase n=1 Tax=Photobacterium aquae TaxID=1195763 RepID=A0A0J1HCC8_9GAMM|nr:copper-translocating P-type ATPase [Photobacterium aquae]KLV09308.1 copper-transporting ATPase [Photobacterium aquae]
MAELTLSLNKVRCMNCAGKIQAALSALPEVQSADVDTHRAVIQGDISAEHAIATISALGYGASFNYHLQLSGLNCGKCIGKVRDALEKHDGMALDITTTELTGQGSLAPQAVIEIIRSLGYQASAVTQQPATRYQLKLSGLNCGKCVAKVEAALADCDSVEKFTVSKTAATVVTTSSSEQLVALIKTAGFEASLDSEQENTTAPQTAESLEPQQQDTVNEATTEPTAPITANARQFMLSGMTCASCVASVEKAIRSVPGVSHASVNLAERTAMVDGTATPDMIAKAVADSGYGAELVEDEQSRRARQQAQNEQTYRTHMRNAYLALGAGIPMMAWGVFGGNMMINSTASQWGWGLVGLITLGLLATVGRHFYVNAWKAFKHHRASMDTLVALGTGAAWLYSMFVVLAPELLPDMARHVYFEASAMILGLITLGHALEARARSRTSKALEQLMDLQPPTAIVVDNGREREVPLAEVKAGMLLRLRPGAKVPVDGTITQGDSYIDESMLTGEPLAAHKKAGDTLHAGTINQNGSLLFTAEKIGQDTMLARIIELVRQAQGSKPALARLADRISAVFVPAVMIIAITTAMIWYYVGPQPSSIYMLITATTVLIIACPCALGLATPMSVTVGVGRAAEFGVLIRNAEAMQIAADIDTVVLDKTGTLTEGKPQVIAIHPQQGFNETQLLSWAASLEQGSEHPLAKAVISAATAKGLGLISPVGFSAKPGYGIEGKIGGHQVALGNLKYMQALQIAAEHTESTAEKISEQGATAIFIAVDNQLGGIIGISDPIRHDSLAAVSRLKSMGLNIVMLTGDTETTARAIAKQAGIDHVIAGVLPDGKADEVIALQQQGKKVAMVGDGINDAPALAKAEIGIAMGSGSDIAIESAQFTLVRHSLHGVADAIELSRATLRNMKQNLFGAFVYNTLGIPVAAGILFPFTGALLSPVVAGAAMALSSITVVSNANRLRLFTPKGAQLPTSDRKGN